MSSASSIIPLCEISNRSRIVWFWQTDSNSWERYSDFESEHIEEAYQRNDVEIKLNDYVINFKLNIHKPIKREEIHLAQCVRQDRFCYTEKEMTSLENEFNEEDSFFSKWLLKNQHLKRDFAAVAKLAAEGNYIFLFDFEFSNSFFAVGILQEGKLLNQETDAQRMANEFYDGINKVKNLNCAARLYTAGSFLYKLVNASLRNNDLSRMDTLGPFCYLLYHRLRLDRVRGDRIVYRGVNLTDKMVNAYEQRVGKEIIWPEFISTSKDRQVAEIFGVNALFIISSKDTWRPQNDISQISYYPDEQEVLLSPFHKFIINKIELNYNNGKRYIYITTSN